MAVTVNLIWDASQSSDSHGEPDFYNVFRDSVKIASGIIAENGVLKYDDSGLPDAVAGSPVAYEYKVSATNAAGEGPQSSAQSISI
jgi:hypothetical protein